MTKRKGRIKGSKNGVYSIKRSLEEAEKLFLDNMKLVPFTLHHMGLEWKEKEMIWYVDGATVFTLKSEEWWSQSALDSETAPFDVDFFILINLAVGGNFDGGKEPPADFTSACMEVDYVRVYAEN